MDVQYNITSINNTTDSGEFHEVALPPETALQLQSSLQAIMIATILIGITSMIYLHSNRRVRKRIYGPLASGTSNLMMFMVGIGLVIVALFQFSAITFHDVPCVLHSVLSTCLIPISGTVFLLRAWVLVVQFARVHEQLRCMKLYQVPVNRRAELENQPLSLSTRIGIWITSHPTVMDPRLLIPICIIFSIMMWIPSVIIEAQNQCDHEIPNRWNDSNVFIFLALAVLLATQLHGKIDTIGIRKELQIVAAVFVMTQMFQMVVDILQHSISWNFDQDAHGHDEEHGVELAFSFWYQHTVESIEILLLIIVAVVHPAFGIFMHKDRFSSSTTVQQKLQQILNDRRLKEDFRNFLQREFSMENLTFYDMVASVLLESRTLSASNTEAVWNLQHTLIDIYQDFVIESGRFQVNLPNDDRHKIEKSISELKAANGASLDQLNTLIKACIGTYSQAQNTIFNLMATDSLPRFLRDRAEDYSTLKSYNTVVKSGVSTNANVTAMRPTSYPSNTSV